MANKETREELISPLFALSPIDGRYWAKAKALADYFSEGALFRYRVKVEIEYLLALVRFIFPRFTILFHSRSLLLSFVVFALKSHSVLLVVYIAFLYRLLLKYL